MYNPWAMYNQLRSTQLREQYERDQRARDQRSQEEWRRRFDQYQARMRDVDPAFERAINQAVLGIGEVLSDVYEGVANRLGRLYSGAAHYRRQLEESDAINWRSVTITNNTGEKIPLTGPGIIRWDWVQGDILKHLQVKTPQLREDLFPWIPTHHFYLLAGEYTLGPMRSLDTDTDTLIDPRKSYNIQIERDTVNPENKVDITIFPEFSRLGLPLKLAKKHPWDWNVNIINYTTPLRLVDTSAYI